MNFSEPVNLNREGMMVAERIHNCWEIMQCDDKSLCPVRMKKNSRCWEWMAEHNEFQCHYGLCDECIVYLCNNKNTILSERELEQVMISRGLYEQDIAIPRLKVI
jgi:hypothetical protein